MRSHITTGVLTVTLILPFGCSRGSNNTKPTSSPELPEFTKIAEQINIKVVPAVNKNIENIKKLNARRLKNEEAISKNKEDIAALRASRDSGSPAGGYFGPLVIRDMTGFRESPSGSSGHPVHGGWLCYATVGTPPPVNAHRATDPGAFTPTPSSILEMVDERFGKVDERFGKVDERLDRVEARVTKLEKGASHPTPAPKPAPVPEPEPEAE